MGATGSVREDLPPIRSSDPVRAVLVALVTDTKVKTDVCSYFLPACDTCTLYKLLVMEPRITVGKTFINQLLCSTRMVPFQKVTSDVSCSHCIRDSRLNVLSEGLYESHSTRD